MARIETIEDFNNITSNITSFSHAYLFNVNSLELAYPYIKQFAKQIILGSNYDLNNDESSLISYQIDNNEFDDLYIVNPSTIGINAEEINKLTQYMETKSLRDNGKRVYVIYGFERLSSNISNKILKFLEEPNDNIYALLLTENYEKILPTIISRCQRIDLTFPNSKSVNDKIELLKRFLKDLLEKKNKMIAYEYDYFLNVLGNRLELYDYFEIMEKIISETINNKYGCESNNIYVCGHFFDCSKKTLINLLDITNRFKSLIKTNINLNLLIDRYIIEITEELSLCKE